MQPNFPQVPPYYASCNSHTNFFFASPTIFRAVVAEISFGLPDHGLVSAESIIFHFLIRVRTQPIGILNSLDIFYILFLLYKVQLPSPADPSMILLLSPWLGIQQHPCSTGWNMHGSVWTPETLWLFIHTQWLQANRSQVRMNTFGRHLNLCVSTCVYVIRPKPPGYVNFWSGSFE